MGCPWASRASRNPARVHFSSRQLWLSAQAALCPGELYNSGVGRAVTGWDFREGTVKGMNWSEGRWLLCSPGCVGSLVWVICCACPSAACNPVTQLLPAATTCCFCLSLLLDQRDRSSIPDALRLPLGTLLCDFPSAQPLSTEQEQGAGKVSRDGAGGWLSLSHSKLWCPTEQEPRTPLPSPARLRW